MVGPPPPFAISSASTMYIKLLPAELLMLRQFAPPGLRTQSASPAQSLLLVSRMAVVPYGAGNVNGPRVGMMAWMSPAVRDGRVTVLVESSTMPPGAGPVPGSFGVVNV